MKPQQFNLFWLIPLILSSLLISLTAESKPKTVTLYAKTPKGFIKAKIKNETFEELACYIAIDGHKKKFRLLGQTESQWFTATDKHFNHTNFSTWCDYIDLYPQYKKYKQG
ncbi:hypothetical protein [Thalassotalea piscium]|uniref:Uncharacterized protein n=1 Tax=Thalassotalea piscium TaxID=1230533 RepID=A0A7X0NFS5_9GAMM|nr:hypothetical protein [Thalassotalea piscium]MBB6542629.1 hypothetical protein [Thalassotalea piscium]